MLNERTACFPKKKWRFNKTDPHCAVCSVISFDDLVKISTVLKGDRLI